MQEQRIVAKKESEESYKNYMEKVLQVRKQLEPFSVATRQLSQIDAELNSLRKEYVTLQSASNPYATQEQEYDTEILKFQNSIQEKTALLHKITMDKEYMDFWVDAFGLKGLKNYILDSRLQEMTDAANVWVKMLTGGTIWIRFDTQKMGRSTKKLSNDINIRVFRYNPNGTTTERNYKSWSGGEKKRVSWAIDFGLSRLVAARATKRYDLLVLDEVFKHVDAAGGEAVVEMLQNLRKEKSSIFVIEHDASFTSHFENRLVIQKKNGRSRILTNEESENGSQEAIGIRSEVSTTEEKPKREKKVRRVSSSTSIG